MSALSDLVIFVEELLYNNSVEETIKLVQKEYHFTEEDAKSIVDSIVVVQEEVYGMWG